MTEPAQQCEIEGCQNPAAGFEDELGVMICQSCKDELALYLPWPSEDGD